MRMKVSLLSLMLIMTAMSSSAMEMNNIEFPNAITVNGVDLVLNGLGKREATIFNVDVYVAALYLESVKDGRKFLEAASRFTSKKPLIATPIVVGSFRTKKILLTFKSNPF